MSLLHLGGLQDIGRNLEKHSSSNLECGWQNSPLLPITTQHIFSASFIFTNKIKVNMNMQIIFIIKSNINFLKESHCFSFGLFNKFYNIPIS